MEAFFIRKLLNSGQIEWNGGVKNCTNEEYPGDHFESGGDNLYKGKINS